MALPIPQNARENFSKSHQVITLEVSPVGATSAIALTNSDIVQGSLTIDRSCLAGSDLEIGNVSSAELTFVINNANGDYDNIAFEGATVNVFIASSEAPTVAYPMGTFIVDEVRKSKTAISLVCLDRMVGLDNVIDRTEFTNSMTLQQIITHIASKIGVTAQTDLVNTAVELSPLLMDADATYRDLLVCALEIGGANAFLWNNANNNPYLCAQWFGSTAEATLDETNRVSSEMQGYEVSVTGVEVVDGETKYKIGSDGYVISIENNPLITSDNVATIITGLSSRLVGFSYQPWSAETLPMPWLLPMDKIEYVKDGTTYNTYVTNVFFGLNRNTTLAGKGESPLAKGYAKKALTRQQANEMKALEDRTEANTQEQIDKIQIGGVNLLLDTNAPSLAKVYGDAQRYFSSSAGSEQLTTEYVEIADAPVDVQYGARFTEVAYFSSNRCLAWYGSNKGVSMVDGQTYTASVYCRITTGTTATLAIVYGRSSYISYRPTVTGNEWQRVTHTFTYDSSVEGDTGYLPVFYFGVQGSTPVGTVVEMCGFQLEQGTKATAYNRNSEVQIQLQEVNNYFWHDTSGAHVSNSPKDTSGKNTLVTSDNFQVRTGTTADATFGTETVIGHTGTGQRNVRITDSLVALRSGTDNYLHFNTSSGTPYITIGKYASDEQNVDIRPNSIRFRTYGTTDAQIAYDSTNTTPQITLGRTGSNQKNVYITNSALQMRTATTVDASFGATNTIGRTSGSSSNVYITSTALQLRKGTTPYINLTTDGVVEVGGTANKKVVITESTLTLQGGTRGSELFAPIKMEGWVTGSGTTSAPYKCLSEVVNGAWTMRSSYDYVTSQSSRGPQGTTCTETVLGWGRVYKTTLLQSLSSSSMTERVFNLDSTNGVEIKPNMLDAGLTISWNGVMTTSDGNIIAPKVIASGDNMGKNSVSVPNAAWAQVGTYTLAKGKYIVMCYVAWNSNAKGIRRCGLNTASATEGGGWGWNTGMQAANGSPTVCQVQGVLNVSSQTTYYLNAYQNSGGALNCNPRWHCVKIG